MSLNSAAAPRPQPLDLLILGNGPVAHSLALACDKMGFRVHLHRQSPPQESGPDHRAWSLTPASLNFLRQLGLPLRSKAPLGAMRVWQADRNGQALPGIVNLHHKDHAPLAAVVPNADLRRELDEALKTSQVRLSQDETGQKLRDPRLLAQLYGARLTLICDPPWHAALGQEDQQMSARWTYDQEALSGPVSLMSDHGGLARQVFFPSGPLALLPLPDPRQASLVWSLSIPKLEAALRKPDLARFVSKALNIDLDFEVKGFSRFPLRAEHRLSYLQPGLVFLGDAAHRIHPLAGQGLNLGLSDVGALVHHLVQARGRGSDLCSPLSLQGFERQRRPKNEAMRALTDQLKHVFAADWGPLRFARTLGMATLDASGLAPKLVALMSAQRDLCPALSRLGAVPQPVT